RDHLPGDRDRARDRLAAQSHPRGPRVGAPGRGRAGARLPAPPAPGVARVRAHRLREDVSSNNHAVVVSPEAQGRLAIRRVAVPTHALAELPEKVTFSQAATLPVAGLTALYALAKGGPLLGRRVLVTGATGGVGDFAVQLARLAGARVTASARRQDQAPALRALGAHEVVVGDEIPPSPRHDLVVESVGGRTLGTALAALERGGVCVTLGVSAAAEVTFDTRQFFTSGRTTLYGFYIFTELASAPASVGLRRLADLVAAGQLAPHISLERPWTEIARVAQDLIARRFPGKAVLTLD